MTPALERAFNQHRNERAEELFDIATFLDGQVLPRTLGQFFRRPPNAGLRSGSRHPICPTLVANTGALKSANFVSILKISAIYDRDRR